MGESGGCEGTHLIHFVDTPLNFWLGISQKLEERGNPWKHPPKLLESYLYIWDPSATV